MLVKFSQPTNAQLPIEVTESGMVTLVRLVQPAKVEALMEAMACGVPVVCSRIRGNTDLVHNKKSLFEPDNEEQVKACIEWILKKNEKNVVYNKLSKYDLMNVIKEYGEIYAGK